MFGDPVGHVWIKREFEHTTQWPGEQLTFRGGMPGVIDLTKEYKEALAGQLVVVMDRNDEGDCLVFAKGKTCGEFIWNIMAGDCKGFIPVIKKNGVLIPAGLDPLTEMFTIAKQQMFDMANHNKHRMLDLKRKFKEAAQLPRKLKKKQRKDLSWDYDFEYMMRKKMGWDNTEELASGFDAVIDLFKQKRAKEYDKQPD